jgi:hypothetical protein
MKRNSTRTLLLALLNLGILVTLSTVVSAQVGNTNKPQLKRPVHRRPTVVMVPVGTNLKVRLNDTLSSKEARVGDKFAVTVLDPVKYNEATVRGHISSIQRSGKVTGRTTMNLAFSSIELSNGKKGTLHGYVARVYGSDSGQADSEGGVQSKSRGKQAVKRGGIGAAAGAIIGGIAGGGKGAAIGLIIGGAGGAGSLAVKGSKELKLESGTEMLVHVTR